MLNIKKQAENMLEVLEIKGLFSRKDRPDVEIQQILSIFETELEFSKGQGKLEFAESIRIPLIEILDMGANYDYLRSKSQSFKEYILSICE